MAERMKRDALAAYERAQDRYMHGRSLPAPPEIPPILAGEIALVHEDREANG